MGLIRRIGRAIGRIGRAIGGAVKGVIGFAGKALGAVTNAFGSVVGGILGGMPFGNLMRGFAQAFMSSPFGMMAASTLGAFGAMLGCAGSFGALQQASHHCCHSQAYEHPCARQNMAHMMAYHQARLMMSQGGCY